MGLRISAKKNRKSMRTESGETRRRATGICLSRTAGVSCQFPLLYLQLHCLAKGAIEGKKMPTTSLWHISKAIAVSPRFKEQWNDKQMEMRNTAVEWHREGSAMDCRSNGACQADVLLPEQNLSDLIQWRHCLQMKSQQARQKQPLQFGAAVHAPRERLSYSVLYILV